MIIFGAKCGTDRVQRIRVLGIKNSGTASSVLRFRKENYLRAIYYFLVWVSRDSLRRKYSIVFKVIETEMILVSSGISGVTHQYFYLFLSFFFLKEKVFHDVLQFTKGYSLRQHVSRTFKTFRGSNKQRQVDRININNGIYDH